MEQQTKRGPGRPRVDNKEKVRTGLIRMEETLYRKFKAHCVEEGYYMAGVINKLVKDYLKGRGINW